MNCTTCGKALGESAHEHCEIEVPAHFRPITPETVITVPCVLARKTSFGWDGHVVNTFAVAKRRESAGNFDEVRLSPESEYQP